MPAAIDLRGQLHPGIAPAHVQRAHALRSVHLVRADRKNIDIVAVHIHRNLAHGLRRVGMEQHPALPSHLSDLRNRLQHANLIVGVHDADQDGLVGHRRAKLIQIDQPVLLQAADR